MTTDIVDRFLRAMLPEFPRGYTPLEREFLMRDTTTEEIFQFTPKLAREDQI